MPADQLRLHFRASPAETPGAPVKPAHLFRVDGEQRSELVLRSANELDGSELLTVEERLPVGTKLLLEAEATECYGMERALKAEYVIAEARPVPASLGALQVTNQRGPLQVGVISGSCWDGIDASYIDFELPLAEDAKPFADVLRYQLLLDGKPALEFRNTIIGPTKLVGTLARIYTACAPDVKHQSLVNETKPGSYRAKLRATLPDGTTRDTAAVPIKLVCDSQPADAGNSQVDRDASTDLQTGSDTITPKPDTGSTSEPAKTATRNNDGCNTSSRGNAPATWLLALLTTLAARRLRSGSPSRKPSERA